MMLASSSPHQLESQLGMQEHKAEDDAKDAILVDHFDEDLGGLRVEALEVAAIEDNAIDALDQQRGVGGVGEVGAQGGGAHHHGSK